MSQALAERVPEQGRPNRTVGNGLWNALSQIVAGITGLIGSVLIVRHVTVNEYGYFSYYSWIAAMAGALGILAFPHSLTKITSELLGQGDRGEAHRLARWVIRVILAMNLVLVLALMGWSLTATLAARMPILVVAAYLIPFSLSSVLNSSLWGQQIYRPVTIAWSLANLMQLAAVVAVIHLHGSVIDLLIATLGGNLIGMCGLIFACAKAGILGQGSKLWTGGPMKATRKRYLDYAWPSTVMAIVAMLTAQRVEIGFVRYFDGLRSVGEFSLAYTITSLAQGIGRSLLQSFYPAISERYGAGRMDLVARLLEQGMKVSALYSLPVIAGSFVVLGPVMTTLYGHSLPMATPLVEVLMVSVFPSLVTAVLGLGLTGTGAVKIAARLSVWSALGIIGVNAMLIAQFGVFGAAWGVVGTRIAYVILLGIVASRQRALGLTYDVRWFLFLICLAGTSCGFVPWAIMRAWPTMWGVALAIVAGGSLYLLGVIYTRLSTAWRIT